MIRKYIKSLYAFAILAFILCPQRVMAAIFGGDTNVNTTETDMQTGIDKFGTEIERTGIANNRDIGDLIIKYVNFILPYLAVAAFAAFVYAGILYVTAYGNDEQLGKAKKIMIYAAIGLIIVILSYSIVNLLTESLVKEISN